MEKTTISEMKQEHVIERIVRDIGFVRRVHSYGDRIDFDIAYPKLTYSEGELIDKMGFYVQSVSSEMVQKTEGKGKVRGLHIVLRKKGTYMLRDNLE